MSRKTLLHYNLRGILMPTRAKSGKKTGRPLLPIDPKVVEAMASVGATDREIGDFCGCTEGTIRKRFSDVLVKARSGMRTRLRQAQFKLAVAGNATMLIWLGKQMLGQADEQRVRVGDLTQMSDDELKALAAGKLPKA